MAIISLDTVRIMIQDNNHPLWLPLAWLVSLLLFMWGVLPLVFKTAARQAAKADTGTAKPGRQEAKQEAKQGAMPDAKPDAKPGGKPGGKPEQDIVVAPGGFIFRHFLHKQANINKLATREDPYHLHKTLGLLSLISFIYRYGIVYNFKGHLGFGQFPVLDWLTMGVHTALAFSSVIFRVPRKRINGKPMVIYEEYRQHAMVFTLRCFSLFAVMSLFPDAPAYVQPVVVMAHHLLADRITAIHGNGSTAVRATGAGAASSKIKISDFYKRVGYLYSLYQFLAIASHILPNARILDLAYNAVIAIQSSAFMMTLYRKRIIRGRTHMLVYSGCLVLSAYHMIQLMGPRIYLLVLAAFTLRINLPRAYSNKYAIWALFLMVNNYSATAAVAANLLMKEGALAQPDVGLVLQDPTVRGAATAALVFLIATMERMRLPLNNAPAPARAPGVGGAAGRGQKAVGAAAAGAAAAGAAGAAGATAASGPSFTATGEPVVVDGAKMD